ncbi:uncharacterized protein LOC125959111 [Anopheles darlingi]|uniref:uncharacterized protein LOC125959111 n=1 Tax=Anopheles darlingi TaxID=43151 RepID=UPI0021003789|nr:uncharacterized protein LOC125959111 [Anopheles darlingi]XP_049547855.1 uncharacterized protein LOC125959111 [Anopheles darlingi]
MSQFTSEWLVKLGFLAMIVATIDGAPSTITAHHARNPDVRPARKRNVDDVIAASGGSNDKPSLTTYDQRQNGKYNIHVNIKDVKIIAVDGENLEGNLGDDTDYDYGDYDYDPAHLTVSPLPIFGSGSVSITKPPKSTTKAPPITSTTTAATTTMTTTTRKPMQAVAMMGSESVTQPPKEPVKTPLKPTESSTSAPEPITTEALVVNAGTTELPPSNIIVIKPTPAPVQYDYQEIPVQVIMDPILRPGAKYRSNQHVPDPVASRRHYEVQPSIRRSINCHEGEYRDRDGNCRARRSGILKLFRLLSSLKEKND